MTSGGIYVFTSKNKLIAIGDGKIEVEYKYIDSTKEEYTNFISVNFQGEEILLAAVDKAGKLYLISNQDPVEIDSTPLERRDDIIKTQGTYECYVAPFFDGSILYFVDYKNNIMQVGFGQNNTWGLQDDKVSIQLDKNENDFDITVGGEKVIIKAGATRLTSNNGEIVNYMQTAEEGKKYYYYYEGKIQKGTTLTAGQVFTLDSNFDISKLGLFVIPD